MATSKSLDRFALLWIAVTLCVSTAWEVGTQLAGQSFWVVGLGAMMVPLAVTVVFVKLVHRESFAEYGLGPRAGLGGFRLWLLAFVGPLAVTAPLLLLGRLVFHDPIHPQLTPAKLALTASLNIPLAILVSTFTNSLGEELGWRGYLLRRLRRTLGWRASTLVIGPVWAAFHLPLVLLSPTGVRPGVTAVTYTVAVIALAVPFTWFAAKARRGSVLVPSLLHASLNAWNQTLVGEPAFAMPGLLQANREHTWILSVEGLAGAVICCAIAVPFWLALGRLDRAGAAFEPPRAAP